MAYRIELGNGKYVFTQDNGVVGFERNGEPSNHYVGNKAVYLLLARLEEQEKLLSAYSCFQGDVETALHKVHNDRLETALEELAEEKQRIKEAI